MLIDFDWCGKDGEDRYLATLNPNNAWPEDVSPYMHKAHDTWQLDRLASGVKVWFSPVQHPLCLNLELDFWFSSGKSLNFEPNLQFQFSSGSNLV